MDKGMAKSRGNTNESSFGISPVESQGKLTQDVHWMTEEAHAHAYTIPVEWRYVEREYTDMTKRSITSHQKAEYKQVTILRCACGEETYR